MPSPTDHPLPWSEEDYLALGETPARTELVDGCLLISVSATPRHQIALSRLVSALDASARPAGLHALGPLNIRLGPDRILNPDIALFSDIELWDSVVDSCAVRLVAEVTTPSTHVVDHILKPRLYAEAGIEWYLISEPETGLLRVHRRSGDRYVRHSEARRGSVRRLTEPVVATIRPDELLLD